MKPTKRAQAIELRRQGITYQEIIQHLGVAKSTVWRWFKAEGLVETQPQRLTELKRIAQRKASAVVKERRIAQTQAIMGKASREIGSISRRDLWLLGLALYWAEGAKQKPHNVSVGVILVNSDPAVIRLFVRWLQDVCGVTSDRIGYEMYLHETANGEQARVYWAEELGLPIESLSRIRWKHHRPATHRTNIGDSYHGLIRVRVTRSSALNRRITGWIAGINHALGSGAAAAHLALDQEIPGSNPGSPAVLGESGEGLLQEPRRPWRVNGVLWTGDGSLPYHPWYNEILRGTPDNRAEPTS